MNFLFVLWFFVLFANSDVVVSSGPVSEETKIGYFSPEQESQMISNFRKYIQIDTAHPTPDYETSVEYLDEIMKKIGLETHIIREVKKDKPMIVGKWKGFDSSKPSILLSSHMDVVYAEESAWKHPPFSAHFDKEKNVIYGRGTQDMKSIGMAYLEAINILIQKKFVPKCDIYVLFTVDEETGSHDGLEPFVKSETFKSWNIGVAFDEGEPSSEDNLFDLYYGERGVNWVKFIARGRGGHGSQLVPGTAMEKIIGLMGEIQEFRRSQEVKLKLYNENLGEVTTININAVYAGKSSDCGETFSENVIPKTAFLVIDMRTPPNIPHGNVINMFDQWCEKFDVTYEWIQKPIIDKSFSKNWKENMYFKTIQDVLINDIKGRVETKILPYATDSRYVREQGIVAFGISPVDKIEKRFHNFDEYIEVEKYFMAIRVYLNILSKVTLL